MHIVYLLMAATSHTRFTGGLLGASVIVDVPQPTRAIINVCVAGHPVIVDGRAETLDDGRVVMDDETQTRLRNRGITIHSMEVTDETIVVTARIPFIGIRRVVLRRQRS